MYFYRYGFTKACAVKGYIYILIARDIFPFNVFKLGKIF